MNKFRGLSRERKLIAMVLSLALLAGLTGTNVSSLAQSPENSTAGNTGPQLAAETPTLVVTTTADTNDGACTVAN